MSIRNWSQRSLGNLCHKYRRLDWKDKVSVLLYTGFLLLLIAAIVPEGVFRAMPAVSSKQVSRTVSLQPVTLSALAEAPFSPRRMAVTLWHVSPAHNQS